MGTSEKNRPLKILHVITGLSRGGAETMLHKLIAELSKDGQSTHSIIALNGENAFDFDSLGARVELANLANSLSSAAEIRRLRSFASSEEPDIVHGWMYHANAIACLIAPKATPLIAGIRCTLATKQEKVLTRASIWLGPALIRARNGRVVYCSEQSRQQHEAVNYPAENALVIPNGFDCELFKPDPQARDRLLHELQLDQGARLVGHAARYHPMKNHASLIRAFANVASKEKHAHLVLAGREVSPENGLLSSLVNEMGIGDRVHFLGERADMSGLLPAFDVYASSSAWGEAFPNVLGEAMACGVPCVATDVGESAMIVADTGRIVRPNDDAALAQAMLAILALSPDERKNLGSRARDRIARNFSLSQIAATYANLYRSLARAQ
jgi:glycosyltransferase involved in cell wall biosynthesis